jgi:hypothetical protein
MFDVPTINCNSHRNGCFANPGLPSMQERIFPAEMETALVFIAKRDAFLGARAELLHHAQA